VQNRYCRRTKLSEESFLLVLAAYCGGRTATDAHQQLVDMKVSISRQTIEKKYLDLGRYLYLGFYRRALLDLVRKSNPTIELSDEKLEPLVIDHLWKAMRGTVEYAVATKPDNPESNIESMIAILQDRWRSANGLARSTFYSHVGYAGFFEQPSMINDREAAFQRLKSAFLHTPL